MKKWLKENIFVKDMFVYILIAAIIFYIPAELLVYYGIITANEHLYYLAGAYVAFWAGPFTPTIPVILAIAVFLKQVVKFIQGKRRDDQ